MFFKQSNFDNYRKNFMYCLYIIHSRSPAILFGQK
jgi:hypothetical protein